jgi:uncharacterized protein YjbJ (UPF0337 family)
MMETMEKRERQSTNTPEMFNQQWSHIRQKAKSWWDRLTDADLEQVAGQKEQLVRTIEARYGYPHERAEQEVDRYLAEFYQTLKSTPGSRLMEGASSAAHGVASEFTKTAGEVGATAQKAATTAATSIGDTVARVGAYLPELPAGLAEFIRRHPLPSLMVGMGLGFLLGRSCAWTRGLAVEEERAQQGEAGFPDALIQCSRCGEMVRQADMVSHSTTCRGTGLLSHGGSTS